jgi:hypothetical protein
VEMVAAELPGSGTSAASGTTAAKIVRRRFIPLPKQPAAGATRDT